MRFEPKAHLNNAEAVLPVKDGLPKYRDLPVAIGGVARDDKRVGATPEMYGAVPFSVNVFEGLSNINRISLILGSGGAMSTKDSKYFARRAAEEVELASRAKHPAAVEAHQQLSVAYQRRADPPKATKQEG